MEKEKHLIFIENGAWVPVSRVNQPKLYIGTYRIVDMGTVNIIFISKHK